MIEIERKFLVKSNNFKSNILSKTHIVQGFLNTDPERTVRVRIRGNSGTLTIKGESSNDGLSRFEWETEVSKNDAEALLKLCEKGVIEKTRFEVAMGKHVYEIDEFSGDNLGLTIAEIELNETSESFLKPDWLGEEVTGIIKYYNSQLSKNPYKNWKQ